MSSPDSFILQSQAGPVWGLGLRVISSPESGLPPLIPLCPPGLLIGSDSECGVSLADSLVAPAHCLITVQDQAAALWTLPGGVTLVNGRPVSRTALLPGDEIRLGRHLFLLEGDEDSPLSPVLNESLPAEPGTGSTRIGHDLHHTPGLPEVPLELSAEEMARSLYRQGLLTAAQRDWVSTREMVPFVVDQYEVQNILGSGGMGWVYLARSLQDQREVALKMLPVGVDPGIISRLELEARAGVRLVHPNLVRTYSWRRTSEVFYLVMEWVEGVSLNELVQARGPLPWPQVCDIGGQIARGLSALHGQHMIHRDVKPTNLLIDRQGVAKLLDFGLTLDDRHHDAGEFSLVMIFGQNCLGTPDYMPPEQAQDSFAVDHRADLYSLGCTMYYALTGELPYPGDTWDAKIQAHRASPQPRLPEHIPPAVRELVSRLMAKQPGGRFGSATEVAQLLEPLAERRRLRFKFDRVLEQRHEQTRQRVAHLYRTQAFASCQPVAAPSRGEAADGWSDFELNLPGEPAARPEFTSVSLAPNPAPGELVDARLQELLTAWPHLSTETRRKVLSLIRGE